MSKLCYYVTLLQYIIASHLLSVLSIFCKEAIGFRAFFEASSLFLGAEISVITLNTNKRGLISDG